MVVHRVDDVVAAASNILRHTPVAVLLAVLEASLATHEHGRSVRRGVAPIKGTGRRYTRFQRDKAQKSTTFKAE